MKENRIKDFKAQIRMHKNTFVVYCILRGFVLLAAVMSIITRNFESLYFCVLTLVLFLVPAFVERNFKISLPSTLEIIIMLFIFCAEILGEMNSYYVKFPFWDTMLHTINGFLCAAIGFALVDLLNKNDRVKFELSPFYLAVVAFCFSMTIGVLWEFFEFGCDVFFHTDMQKDYIVHSISSVLLNPEPINKAIHINSITETAVNGQSLGINGYLDIGLYDTMKDLLVNFVGAVVFSVIGYFYVKTRGKNKFVQEFIPTVVHEDKGEKEEILE